ncbi:hypothetical protein Gotri_020671 [Gossypium trilobum]|uniref:Uncharacterized protein n=1 Tax=Gossypium trilobum TaxID=34281 RepID=A0A7J9DA13_9ROSI|nr:hypothetical protein [Gossypium trilobum]
MACHDLSPFSQPQAALRMHCVHKQLLLLQRGHELHIFTSSPNSTFPRYPVTYLVFHPPKTTADGYLEQAILLRTPKEQAHVLSNRVMKVAEAVIVLVSGDGC